MVSRFIAGLSAGIIVTLGIMVGLMSGTQAAEAVLSGIVVVAIVESASDAFGEYLGHRTDKSYSTAQVWKTALKAFMAKLLIIVQFVFPFIFLPLEEAVKFSIFYGLYILSIVSGYVARQTDSRKVIRTILLYDIVAILLMVITYYIGDLIAYLFSVFGM